MKGPRESMPHRWSKKIKNKVTEKNSTDFVSPFLFVFLLVTYPFFLFFLSSCFQFLSLHKYFHANTGAALKATISVPVTTPVVTDSAPSLVPSPVSALAPVSLAPAPVAQGACSAKKTWQKRTFIGVRTAYVFFSFGPFYGYLYLV